MLTLTLLRRKDIRAAVITAYVHAAGYRGVVCFTCGHAAEALRVRGLYVVEISPHGPLQPGRWWRPEEIHRAWPDLFDATCGHLPAPLMARIAHRLRRELGVLGPGPYDVPTGSGETIACLRWAYPGTTFRPVYDLNPSTEWHAEAPLNIAAVDGIANPRTKEEGRHG